MPTFSLSDNETNLVLRSPDKNRALAIVRSAIRREIGTEEAVHRHPAADTTTYHHDDHGPAYDLAAAADFDDALAIANARRLHPSSTPADPRRIDGGPGGIKRNF